MITRYYCTSCGTEIPPPPKKWSGHLVKVCPHGDPGYGGSQGHGGVDYGLMGSPWIRYWNVEVNSSAN